MFKAHYSLICRAFGAVGSFCLIALFHHACVATAKDCRSPLSQLHFSNALVLHTFPHLRVLAWIDLCKPLAPNLLPPPNDIICVLIDPMSPPLAELTAPRCRLYRLQLKALMVPFLHTVRWLLCAGRNIKLIARNQGTTHHHACCVGVTSSGKTFTMATMMKLSLEHLFNLIAEMQDRFFLLRLSMLEIYNEVSNCGQMSVVALSSDLNT